MSPAKIDPLGDYTVTLFDVADTLKPGSGKMLHDRAVVLDSPPGMPPARSGDYYLHAMRDGRIGLAIVYCSGRKLDASLAMVKFPPELAGSSRSPTPRTIVKVVVERSRACWSRH